MEKIVVNKNTKIVTEVELADLLENLWDYAERDLMVNGKEIKFYYDEFAENPLDWDCNPTFLSLLKRTGLGTKEIYGNDGECYNIPNDFDSPEDIEIFLEKNGYIFKRVYGYSHGGLSLALEGNCPANFSSPFDSGLAGFLIARKSDIREWYRVSRITTKAKDNVFTYWANLIDDVNYWLNGEVYYIEADGECYSCYGSSCLKKTLQDVLKEVKSAQDYTNKTLFGEMQRTKVRTLSNSRNH